MYMDKDNINAEKRLLDNGYENIKYLVDYSYDSALIGVSEDNRAVYDFNKMIEYLIEKEGWTAEEAIEWIEVNTLRALSYMGDGVPIIMYPLLD